MRSARLLAVLVSVVAALGMIAPAASQASKCHSSAGDNQYIDPLACTPGLKGTGGSHPAGGSHPSTPPTQTTPTSTTPTATVANTSSTTTTTSSSSGAKDPKGKKQLPFTGLDLLPALLVASVLLGGGLVLRRLTAADEPRP